MFRETSLERARRLVYQYVKERLEKTDTHVTFGPDEVYIVWFGYTLGHWKALLSTTLPDGMYYEVTHNGNKAETYIDAYKKFENVCIKDEDDINHPGRKNWMHDLSHPIVWNPQPVPKVAPNDGS